MAEKTQTSNQSANTNQTNASSSPSSGVNASSQTGKSAEKERSIATQREGGGSVAHRSQGSTVGGRTADPFSLMRRLSDDMDQLFQQFGFGRLGFGLPSGSVWNDDPWSSPSTDMRTLWSPQVESFQRGDKLIVRADLPGMEKNDVHVEVDDGMLTISGERSQENQEDRDGFYRSERSYGQFYRAIPLPEGVDAEGCDATFKNGVLEVTLKAPQQQSRKAKKIQVR